MGSICEISLQWQRKPGYLIGDTPQPEKNKPISTAKDVWEAVNSFYSKTRKLFSDL